MNWLSKIRKWPIEKKRIFSLSVAIFLTILVIVLNSAFNILWKDNNQDKITKKNSPLSSIQESFSAIFKDVASVTEQVSNNTSKIIEQINVASSSTSTTSSIVE